MKTGTSGQIIDGRSIAERLLGSLENTIKDLSSSPVLNIILDPLYEVSVKYVELKQRQAARIGIKVVIHETNNNSTTSEVISLIKILTDKSAGINEGLIVQLPLLEGLDQEKILQSIPVENDVDVLNRTVAIKGHPFVQPVAGSVKAVLQSIGHSEVLLKSLPSDSIHVVGDGYLVGSPIINWLVNIGIVPVVYKIGDDLMKLKSAKIIITGAGSSHIIHPEMITKGVILIDAGTSSDSGQLAGDIHPDCYHLASFYTPVPGGVGPITLAKLFENIVILAKNDSKDSKDSKDS